MRMPRGLLATALVAFAGAACAGAAGQAEPPATSSAAPATTSAVPSTLATPTSTLQPPTSRPPLGVAALARSHDGVPRVVITPSGVVLPVVSVEPDGALSVRPLCGGQARYDGPGTRHDDADIVLDAGHGGSDSGAYQFGLREADVNFAVASKVRDLLAAEGLRVLLTREADYYVPLQFRADLASAAKARLFVSIHHNSGGGSSHDGPGTEVYYQQASPEARRLAGLLWEDVAGSLRAAYDIDWWGAGYAGAVFRQGRTGADFYGIMRRTGGVPTALVEVAFLSNRPEAELIATDEFQTRIAQAIARAIGRYFTTDDPGAGFRDTGLGPIAGAVPTGGVPANCREPDYG